jgi:hypothetical protein
MPFWLIDTLALTRKKRRIDSIAGGEWLYCLLQQDALLVQTLDGTLDILLVNGLQVAQVS